MLFIGIDTGTSALKGALINLAGSLEVVHRVERPYVQNGGALRNPELWARLATAVIDELSGGGRPAAIGFTGQMHSLIAIDERDRVLDPVLLWLDMHGAPDLDAFVTENRLDLVQKTGNVPLPDFTLAKWLYACRIFPEFSQRTQALWCAKDFVRRRLDPFSLHSVDSNEASGMQIYSPFNQAWDQELVRLSGIPGSALPKIVSGTECVGTGRAIHKDWGNIPLISGVGDQAAAARAAGSHRPRVASLSLGTSGVVSVSHRKLPDRWDGAFHLFPSGHDDSFRIIGTIPALGGVFAWLRRLLGSTLEELDAIAAKSTPGHYRSQFFPFLGGSGAPHPKHELRASLEGIGLEFDKEELVRVAFDGIAMEFRCILEEVKRLGIPLDEIIISGGATRMHAFTQTLAAFFEQDCFTVSVHEGSAVGAALLAADHVQPGNAIALEKIPISRLRKRDLDPEWLARRTELLGR